MPVVATIQVIVIGAKQYKPINRFFIPSITSEALYELLGKASTGMLNSKGGDGMDVLFISAFHNTTDKQLLEKLLKVFFKYEEESRSYLGKGYFDKLLQKINDVASPELKNLISVNKEENKEEENMNAQQPSEMTNRQELDSKNKAELIQTALEILKKKQPSVIINADDLEVNVLGNDQDILVQWQRKVTFIPLKNRFNEIYKYDIMVSLMTNYISKSHYSDSKSSNYFESDSLFSLTNDDEKIIEIAKQVYNNSSKKGQIYVVEKENNYEIIHITESFRSSQLFEKGTFGKGVLTHKEKN